MSGRPVKPPRSKLPSTALAVSLLLATALAAFVPLLPAAAAQPSLTVTKTANPSVVDPGDVLQFQVDVTNGGDANAATIWLNDTLPSVFTLTGITQGGPGFSCPTDANCIMPNLGAGKTRFYRIQGTVNASAVPGTTFRNYVFVNYSDDGGTPYSEIVAWVDVLVRPLGELTLEKTADRDVAMPGSTVTFTIFYNNTAAANLPYVWVNDTFPADLVYVSSTPPGTTGAGAVRWAFTGVTPGSHTIELVTSIAADAPNGTLANTVRGNYMDTFGLVVQCPPFQAFVTVSSAVASFDDFAKTASASTVPVGGSVRYTIYFNNTGSGDATGITIRDTIPQGTTLTNPSRQYASVAARTFTWIFTGAADVSVGPHSFSYTLVFDRARGGQTLTNAAHLNATATFPVSDPPERSASVAVTGGAVSDVTLYVVLGLAAILLAVVGFLAFRAARHPKGVVEEVFLMHRNGVLLYHLGRSLKSTEDKDKDLLAGMLTIVQDFVRDGFKYGEKRDVNRIEFGEYHILLERGPHVFLAVVLSGQDPADLIADLKKTIDEIERSYGDRLAKFDGNLEPIMGARDMVKRMLRR